MVLVLKMPYPLQEASYEQDYPPLRSTSLHPRPRV
jgi:hypothetical protein